VLLCVLSSSTSCVCSCMSSLTVFEWSSYASGNSTDHPSIIVHRYVVRTSLGMVHKEVTWPAGSSCCRLTCDILNMSPEAFLAASSLHSVGSVMIVITIQFSQAE